MSMQHRYTFEAIDRIFKNIHNDPRSFEDVVFCFYEDFRQILPIVSKEIREQIISTSFKHFSL